MNSNFMSDAELDQAIDRAAQSLIPVGYRSKREQELKELHHGALVQIKAMRQREVR